MDAEQTEAFLRERNAVTVICKTGTSYTLILPDMMRLMAHGSIPYGALRETFTENGQPKSTEGLSEQDQQAAMRGMYELYDALLAEAIIKIDGQDVEMTPKLIKLLRSEDRDELLEYVNRERTRPLVDSPT